MFTYFLVTKMIMMFSICSKLKKNSFWTSLDTNMAEFFWLSAPKKPKLGWNLAFWASNSQQQPFFSVSGLFWQAGICEKWLRWCTNGAKWKRCNFNVIEVGSHFQSKTASTHLSKPWFSLQSLRLPGIDSNQSGAIGGNIWGPIQLSLTQLGASGGLRSQI